jgi:hypothetical protein
MFLPMKTSSADEKPQVARLTVPCTFTINVGDPNNGVNPVDAYICYGTQVTWVANGHKFHVFFKNGLCPFEDGCRGISDQKPTSSKVKDYRNQNLTVFTYGIVVDDNVFDPHVVGGGGN